MYVCWIIMSDTGDTSSVQNGGDAIVSSRRRIPEIERSTHDTNKGGVGCSHLFYPWNSLNRQLKVCVSFRRPFHYGVQLSKLATAECFGVRTQRTKALVTEIMYHPKSVSLSTAVTACLVIYAESFLDAASSRICVRPSAATRTMTRRSQHEHVWKTTAGETVKRPSRSMLMAGSGSKKRRRRKDVNPMDPGDPSPSNGAPTQSGLEPEDSTPLQPGDKVKATPGDSSLLGDVVQGERPIETLFSDDWSGMPVNTGMEKSNVSGLCLP